MRKERLHLNDHGHDCTRHIEVLSIPIPFGEDPNFWPRMGTWLRSTREARLTAREEHWKRKENKQRIAKAERTKIAQNLAPTSIFDCFWRVAFRLESRPLGRPDQRGGEGLAVDVGRRDAGVALLVDVAREPLGPSAAHRARRR
jgi:hypothetical protein